MAFDFIFHNENLHFSASELRRAALFSIEMIKARLACHQLASLRDLESFCVGFICFHGFN
jgi:hypothetical protein